MTEGCYFKEIKWGPVPPLHKFPFLVSYGDPAPSNKVSNKKGVKKLGSYKANFLMGVLDGNREERGVRQLVLLSARLCG